MKFGADKHKVCGREE